MPPPVPAPVAVVVPPAPVAPVVPPPIPFPVPIPPIDPGAERRARDLQEFLAEIQQREAAVGGHVSSRHHSNLTDRQLQDRLTTGLDAQGVVAVTAGISSAFASDVIFQETLRRAEELLNNGLEATRAYLRENQATYRTTRVAAEAAQRAALPNTLADANPQITAFRNARNDLVAAIDQTQVGQIVRHAFMLPVRRRDKNIPSRNQWSAVLRSYLEIELYDRYRLVVWHNRTIGRGFRGTSPRQQVVLGQQITVYGVVQPFQGPADHTFTLLDVRGQHNHRIDLPHNAREWGVTTHFPSDDREESIQGI